MSKTVAILIKFKADVSSLDKPDFAPVWLAATALVDQDPDGAYGDTVFENLQDARLSMIRTLLMAGARLEYFLWGGPNTTIWELAIESRGDTRLLQLLLKNGWADPPITERGNTIAHMVTMLPDSECIAGADCDMLKLLDREQLEAENHDNHTPLFFAIQRNKVKTVAFLLHNIEIQLKYNDIVSIRRFQQQHGLSIAMTDMIKAYLGSLPEGTTLP
ncbi:hypothetical protein T484DRAFT_1757757 [Baffinella frigidus]|nr:hypothetical protein T484DRAFT_1757757 [Cryptophyta sp. CCMP2293]